MKTNYLTNKYICSSYDILIYLFKQYKNIKHTTKREHPINAENNNDVI